MTNIRSEYLGEDTKTRVNQLECPGHDWRVITKAVGHVILFRFAFCVILEKVDNFSVVSDLSYPTALIFRTKNVELVYFLIHLNAARVGVLNP